MQPARHLTLASLVILCSLPAARWIRTFAPRKRVARQTRTATTHRLDRTVLPIPEPFDPPITELDARQATAPPRFEVQRP